MPLAAFARASAPDLRQFLSEPAAVRGDGVHRLGFQLSPDLNYAQTPTAPLLRLGTPLGASVDLSGQLPPVGDQGQQGSCVAWATSYYYKSWSEKLEHTSWSLSDTTHQFSPSFVYNQINGGVDNGSNFDDAFTLMQNKGDVDIAELPYNQNNYTNQPGAMQLQEAKPYRIPSGWTSFWNRSVYGPYSPANDITNAKAWLASGKLLVLGIPVYNDWPDYGSNPSKTLYDYNGSSSLAGGHGVCVVGYDDNINPSGSDADHRGGFKMVNSWGPSWNGNGFVYLSYDFVKRYVWEAWTMGDNSPDTPSISNLSKSAGNAGDTVQINGANFGGLRRSAKVTFNGVSASGLTWTNERVTATVPQGATSGPVAVHDWEGTASNSVQFTVGGGSGAPAVNGISPSGGVKQTRVTITGVNFGATRGTSYVSFGSTPLASSEYSCWSDTYISCRVPVTTGGKVAVTVNVSGLKSNGVNFLIRPLISTFNPTGGRPGTVVTIYGQSFGSWVSRKTLVYFGSTSGVQYLTWTNNKIRVRVPSVRRGAVTLKVTTAGGTSPSKSFIVR